jgi:threonine synthase
MADPHTAVGLGVAMDYRARHPGSSIVSLATAHPAKFPDAVRAATGKAPDVPARLAAALRGEERCTTLPADAEQVKEYIRTRITT